MGCVSKEDIMSTIKTMPARGASNSMIAGNVNLSSRMVRYHVRHLDTGRRTVAAIPGVKNARIRRRSHIGRRTAEGGGHNLLTLRNCSGQFVIRHCRICHEFERFRVFNHSNRYGANMGARGVTICRIERLR